MNDFFDGTVDVDVSTISGRLVDEDNVVSKGSIDISTMSVPYTSADNVNTPKDLLFPNNMGTRAETTPLTTPSPIYQEHSSQVSSGHLHETVVGENESVALAVYVNEVDAQKRCIVVLDPKGCQLSTCKEQCYKSYSGNGICTSGGAFGKYICSCFYNC
ncbi:hypothetical protein BUALT_Bualt16G0126800 [Buddleja alternifolia]|uniref:Defensin-like protein n=1 Tax=Buddleja alternifolia TaxID=168488 RepID=A0AAV6WM05_9LAMI|nr:hypothetical protein BUALT_Bualt16G0126800 [Buddleja alternifolia]